ncbi:ABC transporter ATP-binding protein [Labrys sp. WJW]|uniref:ABC transporter ATP-binding protein n=1 Tax=Labrys sp. WJW TaxID=1737983 RepID=UPI00082B3102|nr:ABC transporter ATP-binding protein [Labrys sp. WJW]OCC03188.1 ABC transporter ATP-binding protein [Labrys sp. WJW]
MINQPLLSVRDLSVDFQGDTGLVHAVKNVSFDVFEGQTLAVVGESGSGKSVTAQAIMGLLSKTARVTGGSCLFRDPATGTTTDLVRLNPNGPEMRAIRGGRIAMIFQEPMTSLSPVHTIGDQVTEALIVHTGCSRREANERALDLFAKIHFRNPKRMLTTYPFELSGGMRQRAMIAMALICRPALLVADEPTTALDVTTQAQILALIKEIQDAKSAVNQSMAVIFITHDLGVVANMADEVVVMYRGEVMELGGRDAIFQNPEHDYLKALMRAVPHFNMKPGERLKPLREIAVPPRGAAAPAPATAGGGPVLQVENVSKTFTMRSGMWSGRAETIQALTNVSLSLERGTTLGLVGESGSGKTTLSRMIMRAPGSAPDSGEVRFDDGSGPRDVFTLEGEALKAYRRSVQFVFQDPFSSLNPRMTVFDILSEPLRIHSIGTADERHERVKSLLELVGLEPQYMRRYPHSFSGGQRQRIGLARALALEPKVILCDEPTSALDVSVQAQILNLLKDLQAALGVSYLFVSHNLAVVEYMARDIAVMCRGHIVEQAPREVLFRSPQHPYTKALLQAIPDVDLANPLDFAKLKTGNASQPEQWPAPFAILPNAPPPVMVEVEPRHFVRLGADAADQRRGEAA